jgi:hypothetical protein
LLQTVSAPRFARKIVISPFRAIKLTARSDIGLWIAEDNWSTDEDTALRRP